MSKHTPGPWVVNEDSDGALYVATKSAGIFIAQVSEPGEVGPEADAHLIKASPDMLEALEEASMTLAGLYGGGNTTLADVRLASAKVDAAIAKAKGETE